NRRLRQQRLHVLWFVHDDDRARGFQVVDGTQAVQPVAGLVDDARVRVSTNRVNRHYQYLDACCRGEGLHLLGAIAAVDAGIEGQIRIQVAEVFAHQADAGVHAFADGDGRHQDDELAEAVVLRQFEDGAQVDIG